MKEPMTFDFLEKGATVKSASHFQLHRQNPPFFLLKDARKIINSQFIDVLVFIECVNAKIYLP